jgi:hypothetical protein
MFTETIDSVSGPGPETPPRNRIPHRIDLTQRYATYSALGRALSEERAQSDQSDDTIRPHPSTTQPAYRHPEMRNLYEQYEQRRREQELARANQPNDTNGPAYSTTNTIDGDAELLSLLEQSNRDQQRSDASG